MATDNTNSKMNALSNHLENGGSYSDMQFNATEDEFIRIKKELEGYNNKLFLTGKDRKQRNKLRKEAERLRGTINESVANINAYTQLYKTNGINLDLSFENDYQGRDGTVHQGADLNFLVGQVFDPGATVETDQFKIFYENGQKMYKYAPGRAGVEYNKNKGITGNEIPEDQWKTISEKVLFGQLVNKDDETVISANGEMTRLAESAEEFTTANDGGKIATIKSFDEIEDVSYNNYVKIFNEAKNIRDITQRDILIGSTTRNYKDDLLENRIIDRAVIEQMGIGSDVFTEEELNSGGGIDPTELGKHLDAKNIIIDTLTNPKTQSEKNIAASEFAKYWTSHARTAFDARRKRMNLAEKPVVGKGGGGKFKLRNVTVRPRSVGGEYFAKETTTNKSMIEFSDKLRELKVDKRGSVFSGEYVNKFGFNFGYDPKKGYFEVDISLGEKFGLWPTEGARYFKTQEDLFQHYNIPTDWIGTGETSESSKSSR